MTYWSNGSIEAVERRRKERCELDVLLPNITEYTLGVLSNSLFLISVLWRASTHSCHFHPICQLLQTVVVCFHWQMNPSKTWSRAQEMWNGGMRRHALAPQLWMRSIIRYEMRRECQEIIPGLLLGPFQASKSLEVLNSLGVTHMWSLNPLGSTVPLINRRVSYFITRLCIRDKKEAFSVKPRFPEHFEYLVLDVEDNEDQNVIRLFPQCVCATRYSMNMLTVSQSPQFHYRIIG